VRRLFIVLCVAAIVPLAAQISELLNSGLPPWIRLGGEERLRFEGFMNSGFRDGNNGGGTP